MMQATQIGAAIVIARSEATKQSRCHCAHFWGLPRRCAPRNDSLRRFALQKENCWLDMDSTMKTLYGHQEGAAVGYNPAKPGRPSHADAIQPAAGVARGRSACRRIQRR